MYQPLLFKSCKRLTLTVVKATTAGPNEIISMSIATLLESAKFSPPNIATTNNKKNIIRTGTNAKKSINHQYSDLLARP